LVRLRKICVPKKEVGENYIKRRYIIL
jgi:hypothetical protein